MADKPIWSSGEKAGAAAMIAGIAAGLASLIKDQMDKDNGGKRPS